MYRAAIAVWLIVSLAVSGCATHRGDVLAPVDYAADGLKERSNNFAGNWADWGDDHPIVKGTVTCIVIAAVMSVSFALVILFLHIPGARSGRIY